MKRRILGFVLILVMSAALWQPVSAANAAKTKTVWVIDYSKSSLRDGKDMIVTYNSKGLISDLEYVNRAYYSYTYNKKNRITKITEKLSDGLVIGETKCTYQDGRIRKTVKTSMTSDDKTTTKYTWKSQNTVVAKVKGRITDGSEGSEKITYKLRDDKQYKTVKFVRDSGNLKTSYTYSKKGFLTHLTYDYGLDYKFTTKLNKRGNAAKITYSDNFSNYETKVSYKYHYKQIQVPAGTYELVLQQQKYLLGLSEHMNLLFMYG